MSDSPAEKNDSVEETRLCRQCGTPLSALEAGEICAACMLRVGFESQAGNSETEQAATSENVAENPKNEAEELSIDEVQALFPDLQIMEVIGQGGMGLVYKAQQKHLGRLVALKLLKTKCSHDPSLAERFSREARALAKLAHPNIVGVHDFGQAGDRPYLIMEFIDGTNLRQMLTDRTLTPKAALAMIAPICDALQFAHEEGVVHRDIKPENILIDRRGRVRIADFGLARLIGRSRDEWTLTGTRQVMGTPHYMAPEQMERPQDVDHRADIFSLGVVLYEMLTGELPIGRFDLPSKKLAIDVRLDQIVLRTLEKEPSRRYQHASDIQTDVQRISILDDRRAPGWNFDFSQPTIYVPAVAFLLAALLDMVVGTGAWFNFFAERPSEVYAVLGFTHLAAMIPLALGGWKMLSGSSWMWMLAAAITGLIPLHYGILLTLPFSIFVLYLLSQGKLPIAGLRSKSSHDLHPASDRLAEGLQHLHAAGIRASGHTAQLFKANWRRVSSWPWRRFVRTVIACFLWFACLGAGLWGYFAFYGLAAFPSVVVVSDSSAEQVKIRSTEGLYLRIYAKGEADSRGFSVLPEQPLRKQVSLGIYRYGDSTPDNRTSPRIANSSTSRRFYSAEGFFVNLGSEGDWEYAFDPADFHDGVAVNPSLLLADDLSHWNLEGMSRAYSPQSPFAVGATTHTLYPILEDVTPLADWFQQTGIAVDDSQQLAKSLVGLLKELGSSGGVTRDSSGRLRLKPIAAMLDFKLLQPQGEGILHVRFNPQPTAIAWWISATGGTALAGCIFLAWLFRLRS